MFSSLSDSLDKTFRNLRGVGKISESNITDALRDVRLALNGVGSRKITF